MTDGSVSVISFVYAGVGMLLLVIYIARPFMSGGNSISKLTLFIAGLGMGSLATIEAGSTRLFDHLQTAAMAFMWVVLAAQAWYFRNHKLVLKDADHQ